MLVSAHRNTIAAAISAGVQARKQAAIERSLLKRASTPADIAAAIVFLCADTGMITAQTLVVDGGYSL